MDWTGQQADKARMNGHDVCSMRVCAGTIQTLIAELRVPIGQPMRKSGVPYREQSKKDSRIQVELIIEFAHETTFA